MTIYKNLIQYYICRCHAIIWEFDCCKTRISPYTVWWWRIWTANSMALPLKALIVIFVGSSTLDTVPQHMQDWHRSCAQRCSLTMARCNLRLKKIFSRFVPAFCVLEHFSTTTTCRVYKRTIVELSASSMWGVNIPWHSHQQHLWTSVNMQKKAMRVNTKKQEKGGMHLRSSQINEIKVLFKNHPVPSSTNAMSIPNSTVGLWQPGNRVVGTVGVLHVSCGGACLGKKSSNCQVAVRDLTKNTHT